MAWELTKSAEMFDTIRVKLELWTREDLCRALADYNYEKFHDELPWRKGCPHRKGAWDWHKIYRSILTDDILTDAIMEAIEDVSTTSNGGWDVYIDFSGWHSVDLRED